MHSVTSNAVAETLDSYKIKHKTVKGTTNVNGILYKDNSGGTITGNELFINAKVTNSNDRMVEVGYSSLNGEWLQVQTGVNAVLSNTYVEIDVIYLEKVV